MQQKPMKKFRTHFQHVLFLTNQLKLTTEQDTLLEKKYKSFSRNGANLKKEEKKKLREIDSELAQLKLKFGENVLAETNKFELLP